MDYHDHPFFTEQFESEAALREANALSFTGEDMLGWDEDDFESAGLAMERDMEERAHCWARENAALRSEIEVLQERLDDAYDSR